ncbi:hypothetical protein LAV41_11150, partial [Micrococcus luteus]|nr:hypothetical protein [Micrococcus yunnanensis]
MLIEDVERLIGGYYETIQIDGQTRQNVAGMLHATFDRLMAADVKELAGLAADRDRLDNERVKLLQAHYADAVSCVRQSGVRIPQHVDSGWRVDREVEAVTAGGFRGNSHIPLER